MLTLYGIKNCDTVKKSRRWLETHGIDYQFHDFRQDGLDKKQLNSWVGKLGWETLLNKRSTTWRNLSDSDKKVTSDTQAIKLLLANPTLIKRPILENNKTLLVGYKEKEFENFIK